jgi:hypothetical protein
VESLHHTIITKRKEQEIWFRKKYVHFDTVWQLRSSAGQWESVLEGSTYKRRSLAINVSPTPYPPLIFLKLSYINTMWVNMILHTQVRTIWNFHNNFDTESCWRLTLSWNEGTTWAGRPLPPTMKLAPSAGQDVFDTKGMNEMGEAMTSLWRKGPESRAG